MRGLEPPPGPSPGRLRRLDLSPQAGRGVHPRKSPLLGSILLALVPVAGLIAVGYALRASGFIGEGFWPQAERLAYFFLLPALLFHSLAMADLRAVQIGGLAAVLVAALCATAAVMIASRRLIVEDGPAFTSAFQGGLRFNNYVGLTAAGGLLGANGLVLAAVCNAVIVPVANVLCILVFTRYGRTRVPLAGVVKTVATNPLVLSCLLGALFQAIGLKIPPESRGSFAPSARPPCRSGSCASARRSSPPPCASACAPRPPRR